VQAHVLAAGRDLGERLRLTYQPGTAGAHPTIKTNAKIERSHYCPTIVIWGQTARNSPNPFTVDDRREPLVVVERLKNGVVREVPLSHWWDCLNPPKRSRA